MTTYTYDDTITYDQSLVDYDGNSFRVGDVTIELLLNSVWTDITAYVRVANGIRITRGRQDEQSAPAPMSCALTLDNRDGRFTPSYTTGAYYPYIARNTQLRVSVRIDDGSWNVRAHGEVSEWPIQFDLSAREVTVDVVASGIRRRLARLPVPTGSVYKNEMLTAATLVGYWPLEDADGATSFASALTAGQPASFSGGGTLADNTTFICSDPLPTFTATGNFTTTVGAYASSASGQQVRMLAYCPPIAGAGTFAVTVDSAGGYYYAFEYDALGGSATLYTRQYGTGTTVATNGPYAVASYFAAGCRMSIELKQNGTGVDTNVVLLLPGAGAGGAFGIVTAPLVTLGRVTGTRIFGTGATVAFTVGHVTVENQISSIFDHALVLTAYAGELAGARAVRIATAAGFPALITEGPYEEQMGPQLTAAYLDVWDDSAYVDGGLSTETVGSFGLQWRGRSAMYDLLSAPVIDLTRLAEIVQITDDQATENDVTVSRTGGGSSRQVAVTGLTPTAVGTYAAGYTLNVYTDLQTFDQASWRMSIGSLDAPRYPTVAFDAISGLSAALRAQVVLLREGYPIVLTATGGMALGIPAAAIIRVAGWTETITDCQWLFSLSCTPGEPWDQMFVLDSATLGILDTDRLAL